MTKLLRILLLLFIVSGSAHAFEPFSVEDIRVEGLQRISAGTVFNYLPVKIGQTMDTAASVEAITALFKTGFFDDVFMERDGGVLVIFVKERAAISSIKLEGNQDLATDELLEGLRQIGLAEGRVFDRSLLEKVEQELQRQYFSRGKYAVRINTTITPLERNRVGILIDISEGRVARIKQINIIGNHTFSDEELLDEFSLTTPSFFSTFTRSDQYSKQALSADLEVLRTWYLDRGYLNFTVNSTQVSITPDKKDIYITVNLTEGEQYKIKVATLSGELVVPAEEIFPLISINPGDVFSRKRVTEAVDRISSLLGDQGYAFANVNTVPELDEENNEVSLGFFVDPGKRVYVRRINMSGNTSTRDEVLRREMRQMEGGWYSAGKVERSRTRLNRLGFFEAVNVETPSVPGTADQLDVNYSVTETSSGSISAGVGFSQSSGFLFNASVQQNNFLGSGKRVSFTFDNSAVNSVYSFAYVNPYWTVDGVSRGFGAYFRETDASEANLTDYSTDTRGLDVNFGIPINEFDTIRFSAGYKGLDLISNSFSPQEVTDFEDTHGNSFGDLVLTGSWRHDSRNKILFPDSGGLQSIALETTLPGSGLEYYKLDYQQQRFLPLTRNLTLGLKGRLAYGDGYGEYERLPFFENFFAGGMRSIRGFDDNTLGPRDSNNNPIGGSFLTVFNVEVLFPVPFLEASAGTRMSAFLDIGNVYEDFNAFDAGDFRYSVGLAGLWSSPLGPIAVSFGFPLNAQEGDEEQKFQFSVGRFF
ncbi:MAG: outer membrane protein assembly factor BamA [Gammaproteobacteria bacterium]|nr:outer membrane protein assembly factor BamA [Gammaproteobacteria bacterium]